MPATTPARPAARAYTPSPAERTGSRTTVTRSSLPGAVVAPSFPSYPSTGPAVVPRAPTRVSQQVPVQAPVEDLSDVVLELLPFVNLRQGARGRRFEVLPRSGSGEAGEGLDSSAVQELISWLGTHRGLWSLEPTSFTINLSVATLEDDRFLRDTVMALRSQGIQAETLGFEIAEPIYTQNRALVERFTSLCDKAGCYLAIDDFSFDTAVLPLLRSRAVRLVKVDARLTGTLQRDKLSEALVTAAIQATRVLGVQCAAKAVESQSLLQWLTAAGCDIAQGPALSGPQPLESLGSLG
jgi:EAL domain-containing protein (putative c-di-GMP-specific phosphodiesterase class I)